MSSRCLETKTKVSRLHLCVIQVIYLYWWAAMLLQVYHEKTLYSQLLVLRKQLLIIAITITIPMSLLLALLPGHNHCKSWPVSSDKCRLSARWPPTQQTKATDIGCNYPVCNYYCLLYTHLRCLLLLLLGLKACDLQFLGALQVIY